MPDTNLKNKNINYSSFFSFLIIINSLFSFNLQFIFFINIFLVITYLYSINSRSILPFILFFLFIYPESFIGESIFDRTSIFIYSIILFFIRIKNKNTPTFTKAQYFYLFFILLLSIFIYLPIPIETYLKFNYFNGVETNYISNNRSSHMLGFAIPVLFAIFLISIIHSTFNNTIMFLKIYEYILIISFLIVILSFIRYFLQFEFIPQGYTDSIRNDGFRISGVNIPDTIGYGKKLLLPFAIVLSYNFSKTKNKYNNFILILLIVSLFFTYSRIIIFTMVVIFIVTFYFNYSFKKLKKVLLFLSLIISFFIVSGGISILVNRSINSDGTGYNFSGRELIYSSSIPIIFDSPFVGLRPGGYLSLLIKGYSTEFNGIVYNLNVVSAHSFYIVIALEWGIPFLILMIIVLFYSIFILIKSIKLIDKNSIYNFNINTTHYRNWAISILSLLISFCFLGITDFIPYQVFFSLIGLSWGLNFIINNNFNSKRFLLHNKDKLLKL